MMIVVCVRVGADIKIGERWKLCCCLLMMTTLLLCFYLAWLFVGVFDTVILLGFALCHQFNLLVQ
jgi:hypothetical protein